MVLITSAAVVKWKSHRAVAARSRQQDTPICRSSAGHSALSSMSLAMQVRYLARAFVVCALGCSAQSRAQESFVTYKSLAPAIALDLAQAALADCQKRGYQVAVAVVDRFGVIQVVLRDRYAGPHTPSTASGKAW